VQYFTCFDCYYLQEQLTCVAQGRIRILSANSSKLHSIMDPTLQEPLKERDLVAHVLDDPEAFERLYYFYFPRVYTYVRYRVVQVESSEDVVSDVFLKVVRGLPHFRWQHEGSFAAWVFRIAHNEVLNYCQRNGRQEEAVPLEELPDIENGAPMLDEDMLRNEKAESLRHLVLTLPRRRQEVITLRFFGELHNHEIATVLGLDERTVASHLCRGLRDLHAMWLHEMARQEGAKDE
jgi:RNA polymerase sigma-70 factor (ECF subfamily)